MSVLGANSYTTRMEAALKQARNYVQRRFSIQLDEGYANNANESLALLDQIDAALAEGRCDATGRRG